MILLCDFYSVWHLIQFFIVIFMFKLRTVHKDVFLSSIDKSEMFFLLSFFMQLDRSSFAGGNVAE